MALIKHRTSKNARYGDVLDYYTMKHQEDQETGHYEPILDENGLMQPRENVAVAYINAHGEEDDPEKWAAACMKTNLRYQKNLQEEDRKNHEYILSHPSEDREKMTMEDLMEEGKAFARENFPGYDCLIAVHRDTDNDHIHVTLNSVRELAREEQPWMMKKNGQTLASEMAAGGKHQNSPQLQRHLNDWLLAYSQEHGFALEDNNQKADKNRAAKHQDKNEQMKTALLTEAPTCRTMKELQNRLKEKYNMELKVRGETLSIQHPDAQKAVRLKRLGIEAADLTELMQGNKYKVLDNRRQIYEAGRLAGFKREEIDHMCDHASQATREEIQAVWEKYRAAKETFWAEYYIRSQEIQNEISEEYKKRRVAKQMNWALDPRNRRRSLGGMIVAAIYLRKADTVDLADFRIQKLKEQQQRLRHEMEVFKNASSVSAETLKEKGLPLDEYMETVKYMQDMADRVYRQNAILTKEERDRLELQVLQKKKTTLTTGAR